MPTPETLVRTKLRVPFTRPSLVARPRLQARVAEGLYCPLTLVIAPAGFGKSTLVTASLAGCGKPVAWLSLDRDDNQEGCFLTYLFAALRTIDSDLGREAGQLLERMQLASPEAALTRLVNDLDAAGREIVLVLDDYQFINSAVVHGAVAFLLEHCPPSFHLLIASRSDPPLPLARLRARGQMVELRAGDLRFTPVETAQFLNDVMGLCLDAKSVAMLEERTEGWIAGLQMAALSMRDRDNVAGFIYGFSGTNRYILEYLGEEVLSRQREDTQSFLLRTSILDRLCASLCDAVLGQPSDSQARLKGLDRDNLFLIPLDDEAHWYRYHHLFADLLRTQLHKLLSAREVAQLHIRAADWHAQNGLILDAINHASAASDDERTERFIEQHYREIISRGEQAAMRYWSGKLSRELVYRRPWLCIFEAHSRAWFGELDEADRLLERAENLIRSEVSTSDTRAMQGHCAYVKSRVTAMRADLPRAIGYCLTACQYVPADNLSLQFNTRVTLGYEYFLNGDYANAEPILDEAIRSGKSVGALIYTVAAACMMARLVAVRGQLHKSHDIYQMAVQLIARAGEEHRDATALVEVGLADVLCEWNQLDAALAHAQQGLILLPMWGKADDFALAYVTLARIRLAQANKRGGQEALQKAIEAVQARGIFPEARGAVEVARVRHWLAEGDVQAANRWAESLDDCLGEEKPIAFQDEQCRIMQARVWIAQQKPYEAVALLSRVEESARSAGRMGRVIEILILKALAMQKMEETSHWDIALKESVALAEREGYARIFLEEGECMRRLLERWLIHADAGRIRDYAAHLLGQFDAESSSTRLAQEKSLPVGNLVEPLSRRELEVLQLIATGRTNQEIADQLIVSPGTVKAHTASIYRKLDVSNRTEAVAHARQLGILN